MAVAGLAADNHPVDGVEVQGGQRPEQWLAGEKTDAGNTLSESVGPSRPVIVLDRRAEPNVSERPHVSLVVPPHAGVGADCLPTTPVAPGVFRHPFGSL